MLPVAGESCVEGDPPGAPVGRVEAIDQHVARRLEIVLPTMLAQASVEG